MSSQAVNSNNLSTNVGSCGISNINSSQSGASNSNKSNTKMSIDHQATLDKGLKMKIKRTKPGTKSSEAKHEIVKATEQQQNGMSSGTGSNNVDESTNLISGATSLSSIQTNSGSVGNQIITSLTGNKKNGVNTGNQLNNNPSSGNNNMSSGILAPNIQIQTNSLGTKRASSGHRREKVKEKLSHSNRNLNEKNIPQSNEKEPQDKTSCNCNLTENSSLMCSSSFCVRRNDSSSIRLSGSNTTIPPGVFTPSTETPTTTATSTALLSVSATTASSAIISHSSTSSAMPNTPGPPTVGGNIKISSHIAAQLAAAAASNSLNGSLNTTDMKGPSQNITENQNKTATGTITTAMQHSISIPHSNNKISDMSSITNVSSAISGTNANILEEECSESPPPKRTKPNDVKPQGNNSINKETVDICIGTSVGTITEPDCLGPCEPGTSVTLEGIVWHETEGGVLVVNVTWRGKTYVGTLLDCTRHDWAPPRFCDSPSEELDSRTPKGRGKRGRTVTTPDLSNFTETRSSIYFSHPHVHSKLRNGNTKGGRGSSRSSTSTEKNGGGSSVSSGNGGSTPSTSPTGFLPPRAEKRKSKDESVSPLNTDNETQATPMVNASGIPISVCGSGLTNQPQSLINPVTGLNVQINTKKCKNTTPCAISPILLECPEQDCSKKYKHANGLRYHQSHAHGTISMLDDDSIADMDDSNITPIHSPVCLAPTANESEVLENVSALIDPQSSTLKKPDPAKLSHTKSIGLDTGSLPSVASENAIENNNDISTLSGSDTPHTEPVSSESPKNENGSNNPSELTSPGQQPNDSDNDIDIGMISKVEKSSESASKHNLNEKAGVLRYVQPDSDESATKLVNVENDKISRTQIDVHAPANENENSRSSPNHLFKENCIVQQQIQKTDPFDIGKEPPTTNLNNLENSQTHKSPVIGKQKKNRKSPGPGEFDVDGFGTCNRASREEVQSPAYSDISDDSTPVNEQSILEKSIAEKNSDIVKKSPEIILSSGSGCQPNAPTSVPSSLSGYGVYQFYQQQQFSGQPAIEPQSNKSCLTGNAPQLSLSASCSSQQPPNNNDMKRKEPPLDLITKPAASNLQVSSPSPHESNKDQNQVQASNVPNQIVSSVPLGSSTINAGASKPVSHFYAFNYMSSNYPFNVDQNYAPISIASEDGKCNRNSGILSPTDPQHSSLVFKEDKGKDSPPENMKIFHQQQTTLNKGLKTDGPSKAEFLKTETNISTAAQIPQMPLHSKEMQGMGPYSNIYQRHPMTLNSQQMSREEELRRYYIFSDQQRRQSNAANSISLSNQNQVCTSQSSHPQCKDETLSVQVNSTSQQLPIKNKANMPLNINSNINKHMSGTKESSPKQKQDDDVKVIKQEGQKPTMETQGPPPPPTSQYFLHPSYITPTPFGFDPNHPIYRNVLMPSASPYNAAPYHLPISRYHAPEDLSRNTGTKALDVLHHAASQYYTTHKIHELSERALKSPNNNNSNGSNSVKVSVSSPSIAASQHSNINTNTTGHHSNTAQSTNSSQISLNLSQSIPSTSSKPEMSAQKSQCSGSTVPLSEPQKSQTTSNPAVVSSSTVVNSTGSGGPDSRSPPPQRHVHTHHHTHVGLGYPMYPAPYGAAVLASQQAAAVAVINPFPPGPTK
uniref:C2H2-type domain-containing protein n=1 Tax=Musca domestica TaxID=7370 RepID=T1P8F5_MUSDO